MKVIFIVFFAVGFQHVLNAQSIEILETNPDTELVIKSKFILFQENTIGHTLAKISEADVKNEMADLANKTLYQLMYWRYEMKDLASHKRKSIASISPYTARQEFTNFGKQLFDLKIISNVIK